MPDNNFQTQLSTPEVILLSRESSPLPDLLATTDLADPNPDNGLPFIHSTEHAGRVLDDLLAAPPRVLIGTFDFDQLQFGKMRSSVLRAGIIVLAVQAGHHAVIAPVSTQLPVANWRSEFTFRAVRGIRLLRPDLTAQQVFFIVTQAIHFYSQPVPPVPAALSSHIH
jgi:hypothetical protein